VNIFAVGLFLWILFFKGIEMKVSLSTRTVSLFTLKYVIFILVIGILTSILNPLLVTNLRAEVFKATAYCSCVKCCNKKPSDKLYGITATGKEAKWGTVAVDRRIIKLGSKLRIEGFPNTIFRAEDVGGAIRGNRIDIWFPSHEEALDFGVKKMIVYSIDKPVYVARSDIN
jgi:3D (Asp-Asp-Asp) domain-containing protein